MKDLKIAVIGANGQLGQSLQKYLPVNPSNQWFFYNSYEVDLCNTKDLKRIFTNHHFDYIINCAAYTAVDRAESEPQSAQKINADAVKKLAEICHQNKTALIHISTDFVFSGTQNKPLRETDLAQPLNQYGKTKLAGEVFIQEILPQHFILRTGWLYSEFGHNFFKTIKKLSVEKEQINVVYDQIGTPTNTEILCRAIYKIIATKCQTYGVYHVANEGVASWFDFAYEIIKNNHSKCRLVPILSEAYPTPAKRPTYSVLDKSKVKKTLKIDIPHWRESLQKLFNGY